VRERKELKIKRKEKGGKKKKRKEKQERKRKYLSNSYIHISDRVMVEGCSYVMTHR
jgi:hypothetical protein